MRYCMRGGLIKGKEIVPGNSPKNDIYDVKLSGGKVIKGSAGEIVLDKETLAKRPQDWINFIQKEMKKSPDLFKNHFWDGGIDASGGYAVAPSTSQLPTNPNNMLTPVGSGQSSAPAENIVKPANERVRQLEAVRDNLGKSAWTSVLQQEYSTLKAKGYSNGGIVKGFYDGGTQPVPKVDPVKAAAIDRGMSKPIDYIGNIKKGLGFSDGGTVSDYLSKSPLSLYTPEDMKKMSGDEEKQDEELLDKKQRMLSGKDGYANGGMVKENEHPMAEGGEVNNSLVPENAFNHYIEGDGILGGTVYDGSTDEKFLFGPYCFDIDKARMISQKKGNGQIPVSPLWLDKVRLNPEHAQKSKSKNPVFVAQIQTPNGLKPLLIDGNHRMYKAISADEKSLDAYIFNPQETASLMVSKPADVEHPKDEGKEKFFSGGGTDSQKFDPDKFLSDTQHAEFNPDEFLKNTAPEPSMKEKVIQGGLNMLPAAGAIAGGVLATPETAGLGTVPGAMAGGVAGQELKRMGEKYLLGKEQTSGMEHLKEDAGVGAESAMGEIGGQAAGKALEYAGQALKPAANAVKEFANEQAVKAVGAMKKDFKILNAKGQTDPLGQFALDKGIVKAGDTYSSIAEKASAAKDAAIEKIDKIYNQAKDLFSKGTPEGVGFNPVKQREEILSAVKSKMGDSADKAAAVNTVDNYLTQLKSDYGDVVMDPRSANKIKSSVDEQINYAKDPLKKDRASEQGYSVLRSFIENKVADHLDKLGEMAGGGLTGQELRAANKEYSYATKLKDIAENRMSGDAANRTFGLTDTISGAGGAMAGAATGHGVEGALLGLGAGLVNKVGRKFGPSAIASGANKLASVPEFLARPTKDLATRALAQEIALNRKGNK